MSLLVDVGVPFALLMGIVLWSKHDKGELAEMWAETVRDIDAAKRRFRFWWNWRR